MLSTNSATYPKAEPVTFYLRSDAEAAPAGSGSVRPHPCSCSCGCLSGSKPCCLRNAKMVPKVCSCVSLQENTTLTR